MGTSNGTIAILLHETHTHTDSHLNIHSQTYWRWETCAAKKKKLANVCDDRKSIAVLSG